MTQVTVIIKSKTNPQVTSVRTKEVRDNEDLEWYKALLRREFVDTNLFNVYINNVAI